LASPGLSRNAPAPNGVVGGFSESTPAKVMPLPSRTAPARNSRRDAEGDNLLPVIKEQ
jgi:hypothetical protein